MRQIKRATALLIAVLLVIACAGCSGAGADRLYALPQMSDEYVQLEALIAERIRSGGEYAAPVSGSNRQTVQLRDLDGDGTPEAIAFLADSTHKPNVCVYRQDDEGNYYLFVAIEGAGSAVSSVEYADLTGDGATEVLLSWQIGGDLRLLSVYSLREEQQTQLLSVDCVEFLVSDLDGDGVSELFDMTLEGDSGTVSRYDFSGGGEFELSEAPLSTGISGVLRLRAGGLFDGTSALFAESRWGEDELITDVFVVSAGELANITMGSSGRSNTLREGEAFASDINGDRAVEIPESSGDLLNWYSLNASGQKTLALTTYHDYDEGWYLVLTGELLSGSASVSREESAPGESVVTFAADGGSAPLLAIYTLTGENRMDRANEEGRFVLRQDGTTVYAAELLRDNGLTAEDITENFNLIYQEWQSGVL